MLKVPEAQGKHTSQEGNSSGEFSMGTRTPWVTHMAGMLGWLNPWPWVPTLTLSPQDRQQHHALLSSKHSSIAVHVNLLPSSLRRTKAITPWRTSTVTSSLFTKKKKITLKSLRLTLEGLVKLAHQTVTNSFKYSQSNTAGTHERLLMIPRLASGDWSNMPCQIMPCQIPTSLSRMMVGKNTHFLLIHQRLFLCLAPVFRNYFVDYRDGSVVKSMQCSSWVRVPASLSGGSSFWESDASGLLKHLYSCAHTPT